MAIVQTNSDSVPTRSNDWRHYVKTAIRDPIELCRKLQLSENTALAASLADQLFSTFVPEPFLNRICPGDPTDPLLLQVLPQILETRSVEGFVDDAVGDLVAEHSPGVIHKYHGRALLIVAGVCGINCRYCFRRHFPYHQSPISTDAWQKSLQWVRDDKSISEIILSGGDPLMMVDSKLGKLVKLIEAIPHVRRLRVHSRMPIVIPQRITNELLSLLVASRLVSTMVVHSNHPNELDGQVADSINRLVNAGVPVLNQSVLLRHVNDESKTLVELSHRLLELRCIPYYLHQLDPVAGAAHFKVPIAKGISLIREMRDQLPGFAVPRYVAEEPGESSKTILA